MGEMISVPKEEYYNLLKIKKEVVAFEKNIKKNLAVGEVDKDYAKKIKERIGVYERTGIKKMSSKELDNLFG